MASQGLILFPEVHVHSTKDLQVGLQEHVHQGFGGTAFLFEEGVAVDTVFLVILVVEAGLVVDGFVPVTRVTV